MIIDFENMETQVMNNFKDGEGSSEIIFVQDGCGKVLYQGQYIDIKAGDVHYCPCGDEHSLINDSNSDLSFFAVVPQHK